MPLYIHPNSPLPTFRVDIRLYKGPIDTDGSPTYNLFDPVKAQYYKITWRQSLILKSLRPGITLDELCQELNSRTTVKITRGDIKEFFEDALKYDLLEAKKTSLQLIKENQRLHAGALKNIFYKYLYFRVPLLKPHQFLKKTLPYVQPLASRAAFLLYFLLTSVGIVLLINRFPEYVNTFIYFFNLHGFLIYLFGIIFFKFIHEFAHAYTAAYYKVHIPSMGIAFILLVPVLYTDTTDGWKLSNRKDRIKISAAGVMSELVLAGLSTLGWAISPPGALQSVFFVISSVLWLSSILINLNPAMRYDGYYLLSDWLEIDNLQSRAFNLTRWWVYYLFLGTKLPYPEEDLGKKMTLFLILYSIYTWIYRLIFYTALALVLYFLNKDLKIVGVVLFLATIYVLLIAPIASEISEMIKLKRNTALNLNTGISIFLLLALGLLLFLPLPGTLKLDAIAVATHEQSIYVPENAEIKAIQVQRGDLIKKGQVLIELSSPSLQADISKLQLKRDSIEREIRRSNQSVKEQTLVNEKFKELESIKIQLNRLDRIQKMLNISAEIPGELIFWEAGLKPGQYVHKGTHIGTIARPVFKITAFVPEDNLSFLSDNQRVKFKSNRSLEVYEGSIDHIHSVRTEYLKYPILASTHHGNLPVIVHETEPADKKLVLAESMYEIEIKLEDPTAPLLFGEPGVVTMSKPHTSYLDSLIKSVQRVFWRESGI